LRHRAHLKTEARVAKKRQQRDEHQKRKTDYPHAVIGDGDAADVERTAHPGWIADVAVVGAEG